MGTARAGRGLGAYGRPAAVLNVNTTYANFQQDARAIDPAGFKSRPKEPLAVAVFALALPSPAFPASRLDATRPVLGVGATRWQAVIPGTTFPDTTEVPPPAPPPMPPAVVTNPASDDAPPMVSPGPPPDPDPGPPGPPMQVIYPVPLYTGIVVLNPPEHPAYSRPNPNATGSKGTPATPTPTTTATSGATATSPPRAIPPAPHSAPPLERPSPVPIPIDRELPKVSKPESKPEGKPDAKLAVKAEAKPEVKVDPKPDTAQVKKQ